MAMAPGYQTPVRGRQAGHPAPHFADFLTRQAGCWVSEKTSTSSPVIVEMS
ncbi:MAG: hypothetical protein O3A18_02100 [Planctomycetota bacterium]|nr:hypothetical protein [Planctomycetota bacterium]